MKIDLGKKSGGMDCPCPISTSPANSVYYPSLYLEGSADLKDIPESGELTVRFKRISQRLEDRDGKKRYSIELEVRQITGVKAGDAENEKSGEAALDELAESLGKDEKE